MESTTGCLWTQMPDTREKSGKLGERTFAGRGQVALLRWEVSEIPVVVGRAPFCPCKHSAVGWQRTELFVLVFLRKEKLKMLPASYLWIRNLRKRFIDMNVSKGMSAPTCTPTGTPRTRT